MSGGSGSCKCKLAEKSSRLRYLPHMHQKRASQLFFIPKPERWCTISF